MRITPPADNHIFSSSAEMKQHYKEVHDRIYCAPKFQEKIKPRPVWLGIQVEVVISMVANFYRISKTDLLLSKMPNIVCIRYVAMYLAYHVGKKPLRKISKAMGYHLNTVCEGINKIKNKRLHNPLLHSEINALRARLESLPLSYNARI